MSRSLAFGCLLLTFLLSMTTFYAQAATKHPCAPQTPPTLPGTPLPVPATTGILFINEVLTIPATVWNCSNTTGKASISTDTWVELYNSQSQPYNLYAAHTTFDSGPGTNNYYFPFGASIAAKGFLVLFPYLDPQFQQTATSTLRILIAGVVADQITLPSLGQDQSYARVPDGSTKWQISSTPTIGTTNTVISTTPTHTPTSSTRRTSGSSSSSNGSSHSSSGSSSSSPHSGGVQPTWTALQLPTSEALPPTLASTPSTTAQPASTLDLYWKIGLTLLIIALAGGALFWCWRLFRTP